MWMDCDAMFVDLDFPVFGGLIINDGPDFYISEDGRGLSGGNWIAKKSHFTLDMLQSILNEIDAFDKFDLKDQFALLWKLMFPALLLDDDENGGYPSNVRLLPQRLLNAYPWSLCRPSHHCFEHGKDFIVSFIGLGSLSAEMAQMLVKGFVHSQHSA